MIETYKVIRGVYDEQATFNIGLADAGDRTRDLRGHQYKLKKKFNKNSIRKFSFSQRIINTWNTLPKYVD